MHCKVYKGLVKISDYDLEGICSFTLCIVLITIFGKIFACTKSRWSFGYPTPHDVCGGGHAAVPQVVVESAGRGSRLAPDQIIGKTTVNAMVVLPIFFFGSNL